MNKQDTVIELPSGMRLSIPDNDVKLKESFQSLFGNMESGAAIIANIARIKKTNSGRVY